MNEQKNEWTFVMYTLLVVSTYDSVDTQNAGVAANYSQHTSWFLLLIISHASRFVTREIMRNMSAPCKMYYIANNFRL